MIVTIVIIVLVLVLSGVLISLATRSGGSSGVSKAPSATSTSVPPRGPNTAVYDRFDRVNQKGSLGKAETGQTWQTGQSVWSVADGTARMDPSDPAHGALAVVPLGSIDGTVQVTFTKIANGAGIVFRYQNPFNYWQITAAPKFATWNIRKVVDGQVLQVGNTGVSSAGDGTTIAARFVGDAITIQVDGKDVFAVNDSSLDGAGFVGMVGTADATAVPRWDNFICESAVRPVTTTAPPPAEESSSSRPN